MSPSNDASSNGQPLGLALRRARFVLRRGGVDAPPSPRRASRALVEPDDAAPVRRASSIATAAVPVATSSTLSSGPDVHPGDEEAAPARVLPKESRPRTGRRSAPAGRRGRAPDPSRGLFSPREPCGGSRADCRFARRARLRREELAGVLAAEPAQGGRIYLCAYRSGEDVSWLALDDAGEPVTDRERVREAASLVALCELAEESAGGGELDELRSRLVALRLTENPDGIEEAEEAALAPRSRRSARRRAWPRPRYLDDVGAATQASGARARHRRAPRRSPRR